MAFLSRKRVRRLPEPPSFLCRLRLGPGHRVPRRHLHISSSRFCRLVAQRNSKQRQAKSLCFQAQRPDRQMGAKKGKQVLDNRRLHNCGCIAVSSKLQTTVERANITTPCSRRACRRAAEGERWAASGYSEQESNNEAGNLFQYRLDEKISRVG